MLYKPSARHEIDVYHNDTVIEERTSLFHMLVIYSTFAAISLCSRVNFPVFYIIFNLSSCATLTYISIYSLSNPLSTHVPLL